jgi:hypothetical protein
MFGCESKIRKLLILVEMLPSFDKLECGELSHVMSVFLPLGFAGLTTVQHTRWITKGP